MAVVEAVNVGTGVMELVRVTDTEGFSEEEAEGLLATVGLPEKLALPLGETLLEVLSLGREVEEALVVIDLV